MMQSENRIQLCQPISKDNTFNDCPFNIVKQLKHVEHLSTQEIRVLFYTISGFNAKEIGKKLDISFKTVNSYLDRIKVKTDCHSRSDLVQFAREHHLMDIPDYE